MNRGMAVRDEKRIVMGMDKNTEENNNRSNPSLEKQLFRNRLFNSIPFALRELAASARRLPSYLLYGSTGSGKGFIVKQFYSRLSEISDRNLPYEVFECSAETDKLLHSELFGIEKKTASGVEAKPGRIAPANGGMIHFDEIGKASLDLTDQILVWMERGYYNRLGNKNRQTSRAIVVFTMSENPFDLVRNGKWGLDFLNRFRNIIEVPPLTEDTDRISQLAYAFAESFLQLHSNGNHLKVEFSEELLAQIQDYSWPGNVRELENTVDNWMIEATRSEDSASHSTILLSEDLFNKYPPHLKSLRMDTSQNSISYPIPYSLQEYDNKTKPLIEKQILEELNSSAPNRDKEPIRGRLKTVNKKLAAQSPRMNASGPGQIRPQISDFDKT